MEGGTEGGREGGRGEGPDSRRNRQARPPRQRLAVAAGGGAWLSPTLGLLAAGCGRRCLLSKLPTSPPSVQ